MINFIKWEVYTLQKRKHIVLYLKHDNTPYVSSCYDNKNSTFITKILDRSYKNRIDFLYSLFKG